MCHKINYLPLCLFVALIVTGCGNKEDHALMVQAFPVRAQVKGNILVGPSVMNDPDRFVWGASVIRGMDGKYHMLYSTWECGDSVPAFADSWVLNSKIAYAVSVYPDRDFAFQKIVLQGRALEGDSTAWDAQMVHNPHIRKFDGKYFLYYIGSVDPGPQPRGSQGEHVNKRNRVQQNQKIGVIEFTSFDDLMAGNFDRPGKPLLSPRTRVKPDNIVDPSPEGIVPKPDNIIVVNPSVERRPSDGKFLLFFKGNIYDPYWRGVHGVAVSDSPTGPFTALDEFVFDIKMPDGKIASAEDPYVWYHAAHKKFYAVIKDFSGIITGGQPGLAILESENGIQWARPEYPLFMKKEVILNSGDTIKVNHLERPQILTDAIGDPRVLYAASSLIDISPTRNGESFNVHIPVLVK